MAIRQGGSSLSEKDFLAVQEVIHHLHRCRTRDTLKALFESHILPLLNAHSALYAWTDSDLLSPRLIDSINVPEEELAAIHRFMNEDPQAVSLLTHSHPVIARDIAIPEDRLDKNEDDPFREEPFRFDPFSPDDSKTRDGYGCFTTSQAGVITLALRDINLGAGIHRRLPCNKLWTIRDVRVLEHIRAHILMAIKTIVLTDESTRHKSMVEILAGSRTAIAVVDHNMVVNYCNDAWKEFIPNGAGLRLDPELETLLVGEKLKWEPPFQTHDSNTCDTIYKISGKICRLSLAPVRGEEGVDSWLLQIKTDRNATHQAMRQAGLTKREIEACNLIRLGIDANEIAERLYISPHTVKTHLKRIHLKLGVHTRAQLVAALNQQ